MQDIYLVILFIISLIIAIISLGISIKIYKNYERAMNKLGEGKDFAKMLENYVSQVKELNKRDDQILSLIHISEPTRP